LSAEKYANIKIPSPPLDTQKRIAAFLDEKTAQIDGLTEKKRALLDRLEEKRQAMITQAVTKGLNPVAPMRDSGINWFGNIPAHWNVQPLKRAIFYQEGPGIMAADFREEGIPLLRVASLGGRWATLNGVNFLEPEMVERKWSHFLTELGDLLISASATSGIVSEVDAETVRCIPYTGIIRLNAAPSKSVSAFIRHFVVSRPFIAQIDQLKAGATIQHFGPYHLGLMSLALPPVQEQIEIASHLGDALSRCVEVEEQIETSISKLAEYRSTLITAAITGQIEGLQ
jgi:type I restriction enzyme, S subunit